MKKELHKTRSSKPINGIDYIKDYFSILKFEDAIEIRNQEWTEDTLLLFKEKLKKQYKKIAKGSHPDKVETLDDEVKEKALFIFENAKEGYYFLISSDINKIRQYCKKLNEFKKSLISTNGMPIIPLSVNIDIEYLVSDLDIEIHKGIEALTLLSGYDKDVFKIIHDQYKENKSDKNRDLYIKEIYKKINYTNLLEPKLWIKSGITNPLCIESPKDMAESLEDLEYRTKSHILNFKKELKNSLNNVLQKIESNLEKPIQINYDGKVSEYNNLLPKKNKEKYKELMLKKSNEKFDKNVKIIEKNSKTKTKLIKELFKLIKEQSLIYKSKSNSIEVLVKINMKKTSIQYRAKFDGENVDINADDLPKNNIKKYAKEKDITLHICDHLEEIPIELYYFHFIKEIFNIKEVTNLKFIK